MKILKRSISILLSFTMICQLVGCGFQDTASSVIDSAKETTSSISKEVVEWYQGLDIDKFKEGWNNALDYVGSAYSAAVSAEYVASVGNAINDLKVSINSAAGSARTVAQEAGFAAEKWAAGTFNIDSVARDSSYKAEVVGSNELGSVDVVTNYGENASLKYYQSASGSARAQAEAIIEAYSDYSNSSNNPISLNEYLDSHGYDANTQDALLSSIYEGQTRIIPSDQLAEAKNYLNGKIDKLSSIEGEATSARAKSYEETLSNLKDRLNAPDGTESKPATYEEMQAIAELALDGDFKPEDFNITPSQAIPAKYILKQAMGTGLEAGILETAFTVGPDLVSILIDGLKEKNIDESQLKDVGIEGAIAMTKGFTEGAISNIVVTMCQAGKFGETLKAASPDIVGAIVFLTIEAMIAGYSLATGKITADEYGCLIAEKTMITLLSVAATAAMLAILPEAKIFILIGCLAGGIIASAGYTKAKEVVLEFADGGGFEAIIPVGVTNTIDSAKSKVASLNLTEQASNLKDFVVSTANDGWITIKGIVN